VTFRARLVLAATVGVAIAVLLACSAAWKVSRDSLVGSVDDQLVQSAQAVAAHDIIEGAGAIGAVLQVTAPDGTVLAHTISVSLPVSGSVLKVATGSKDAYFSTISVGGQVLRQLVTPLPAEQRIGAEGPGGDAAIGQTTALQLAVPLGGVNRQLRHLEAWLIAIAALGVLIAAGLGLLVARTAIRPLNQVTEEIEDMATSEDLSHRIDEGGADELGRLRRTFNEMISSLEKSQDQQRQLVLDGSHELRTPLTSLKTNVQVLGRIEELDPESRTQLLADIEAQLDELNHLVGDLTQLARGQRQSAPPARFALDALVEDLVTTAATHARTRNLSIESHLDACEVVAREDRVGLAIGNLLNNAIKWSPEGGTIEVSCRNGTVVVRDHGPGIDAEDLPKVFDRFYRSKAARAMPGSGLGLAIVAQVAAEEHGTVEASNAPDGGAVLRFSLPAARPGP
jgi:two-component system, OmpR family, sensor histidine kinase MprB